MYAIGSKSRISAVVTAMLRCGSSPCASRHRHTGHRLIGLVTAGRHSVAEWLLLLHSAVGLRWPGACRHRESPLLPRVDGSLAGIPFERHRPACKRESV